MNHSIGQKPPRFSPYSIWIDYEYRANWALMNRPYDIESSTKKKLEVNLGDNHSDTTKLVINNDKSYTYLEISCSISYD